MLPLTHCGFLHQVYGLVLSIIPLVVPPSGDEAPAHWVERRCSAMGTDLHIEISGPTRALALVASEQALRAIEATERRLSTWSNHPLSELARLNRATVGQPMALSDDLARELRHALYWNQATSGKFNPAVGPLVKAWDLRGQGRRPTAADLREARANSSLANFEFHGLSATRLSKGLIFDEGGFGKGAGLDAALAALAHTQMSSVRLNLGGQWLVATGQGTESVSTTSFAVAHPRQRELAVLSLTMTTGSLATSGNSERGIVVLGEHLGHLLDPSTGRPAPDFGSLTVLAPTGLAADALSTGLYVMGPLKALEWCSRHEDIDAVALLVTPNGLVALASPGLKGRLEPCIRDLQITFPVSNTPSY